MKYLLTIIIIYSCLWIPSNSQTFIYKNWQLNDSIPKETVENIILEYATGTKAYEMKRTIECESGYKNIQSYIVKDNKREDSWGLVQINLPNHREITKQQALNPNFAIKWMSDNWGKVKWYGWIKKTDTCNIIYK